MEVKFSNTEIITINNLREKLCDCIESNLWFEIDSERARVLYNYINSIEESLLEKEEKLKD